MSVIDDMESVQKEIRELILHAKAKRCTIFEPCNDRNLPKYLKAIEEEMSLFGVKYMFNPYSDLQAENLEGCLLRLVNATWGLLLQHKEVTNNGHKLKDRNYTLQQNNFFLNNMIDKQKKEMERIEVQLQRVKEEKRQLVVKLEASTKEASRAEGNAKRSRSQLSCREHELLTQLKKAEREMAQFKDKFQTGILTSRSVPRNLCIEEYRIKEKKYKETIAKLQENNRQLLQEVISLKEELIEGNSDG